MNKPLKILWYILFVNVLLVLISFAFPKEGIVITKDVSIKFPSVVDYFNPKEKGTTAVRVEKIANKYEGAILSEDSLQWTPTAGTNDSASSSNEKIIHPGDFENALSNFYNKLDKIKDGELVRVLHFGDSQIEGDRISGIVRSMLQEKFGGCGVGYIPITDPGFDRKNIRRTTSGTWEKYSVVRSPKTPPHNKYGVLGNFFQWGKDGASISLSKNEKTYQRTQTFEQISLLYGQAKEDFFYTLTSDTSTLQHGILPADSGAVNFKWSMNGFGNRSIKFSFTGLSPDLYGISLDCKSGVAVDNISMRGSSGNDFSKMDKIALKQQIQKLNVGLIIYEFGVNIVPNVLNDYTWYKNMVVQQINQLKKLAPGASILIVGVSDMCRKEETEFASYPNIEKIRNAQREAAQATGCAFWDLYQVMGGKNSMSEWVSMNPALAEKDYTHFTWRGANIVGNKLGNAILNDYNAFKELDIY
ncbi:MAG: hypothetical protein NT150_14520 [Bacteroidetes bacterium]|nr:hypothetical protein [Bacteroidota bacterium]